MRQMTAKEVGIALVAVLLVQAWAGAQELLDSRQQASSKWSEQAERTEGGREADLVVRVGDIDNLGFGWPASFNPFSGQPTPVHPWPCAPAADAPSGTDKTLLGSVVTESDRATRPGDGYSGCARRAEAIVLRVGALPTPIRSVVFQLFVDDFQAPRWGSHFQVTLDGVRIPAFETALNALDQTGPIGKLITLPLLPEYWRLLDDGTVTLLIDDPVTHAPDGYAIDFVRVLVNPRGYTQTGTLTGIVVDERTHAPIPGATITAGGVSGTTDASGRGTLRAVPAGMAVASAIAVGYDQGVVATDLVAGQDVKATFALRRREETAETLGKAISASGTASVYGIRFDVDSAALRPDSEPALKSVLTLMTSRPESRWVVAGHTDNTGTATHNERLSEMRAAAVVRWLSGHGIDAGKLHARGYGASQPVADNSTVGGRDLNRRVEIEVLPAPDGR